MWGLMMSGKMDYDRIKIVYPYMLNTAEKNNRRLELLFHPGKAIEGEYGKDMDKDYFKDANLSDNRRIEKEAVLNMLRLPILFTPVRRYSLVRNRILLVIGTSFFVR